MRQIFLALTLLATPLAAQDESPPAPAPAPAPEAEEEGSPLGPLMENFARRTEEMMREMIEEVQPELEALLGELEPEMRALMAQIMPRLQALADRVGSLTYYELPELLPNGDIIIRRRQDAPPLPEEFETDPPIDL